MKKFLALFVVIGIVSLSAPLVSKAATLDDILSMIKELRKDVAELKLKVSGTVIGSVVPPGGFSTPLKSGSTGSEVTALQQFLTDKGYYNGPINGVWGSNLSPAGSSPVAPSAVLMKALNFYKTAMGFQTWGSTFGGTWKIEGDTSNFYVVTTNACSADLDGNGDVKFSDFLLLQQNLTNTPTAAQMMYDLNGDGMVNALDIKAWMTQYGKINNCMASNISTAQWLASVSGITVTPPAPSATPAGSNWSGSLAGALPGKEWLWDYQVTEITTYQRNQIHQWTGPITASSVPVKVWVTAPVQTMSNVTFLAQTMQGYNSVESKNGSLYLVQNVNFTSQTGLEYNLIRKYKLKKPLDTDNQITSIDPIWNFTNGKLVNNSFVNKKPIASYNGVLPKFFNYFSTDAKFMVTMRVMNDGSPSDTTSLMGVYDNVPEVAYTFDSITNPQLVNLAVTQVPGFNPTNPQDYYNPTTGTITMNPNKAEAVWFHVFMKPPFAFPLGWSGMSETKTYGTDYARNLSRRNGQSTEIIKNGDFVTPVQQ